MKYELRIYENGKFVRLKSGRSELSVLRNFKTAILADLVKPSIRVTVQKWPYADTLKVTNAWDQNGTKWEYRYTFYGLTGLS